MGTLRGGPTWMVDNFPQQDFLRITSFPSEDKASVTHHKLHDILVELRDLEDEIWRWAKKDPEYPVPETLLEIV